MSHVSTNSHAPKLTRLVTLFSAILVAGSLALPATASAGGRGWDSHRHADRWDSPAPRHFRHHHHHRKHHHRRHHHRDHRRTYVYDYGYRPRVVYKKRWPHHHRRDGVTIIYRDY
ncbi:hypothetical protein ThidrDRAFT_2942 [Thiorhodococcus drewsii AZ1]|uniref:Uncharacterized protein n=1 Tax=Thiorhodococcus drewsii AZ1 TaxID=765913 RepID=G2E3S9_9GAMM|nr:hypothetical protein [Thiorhodococcus drewsii]EGV30021.1 hypothetical protein ThidrDRAFT_2942 [Thiorhodococcus drewsii AZ1]